MKNTKPTKNIKKTNKTLQIKKDIKKKIKLMDFNSNPNIGIYMFVNDKFCLIGEDIDDERKNKLEKTFQVPVYKVSALGTSLLGIFLSGNNEFLLAPQIYDYEIKKIKKICERHNVKFINIEEIKNTFGNNICISNDKILISNCYSTAFAQFLKRKTKYKIITLSNETFTAPGSTCKFINSKFFISQEYKKEDVEDILDDIAGMGTVNSGSNFIGSGVVGNSYGIIIGSQSSSIEIQNLVESLDFL